jgi:hypothetical protein
MKLIRSGVLVSCFLIGLAGAAKAGTLAAGPVSLGSDEYLLCRATNVGKRPMPYTIEVLSYTGTRLTGHESSGNPFVSSAVNSGSPSASLCRVTVAGSSKSIRLVAAVLQNGGTYETRGVVDGR